MTHKLGDKLALAAIEKDPNLKAALVEMAAFEQANGRKPERLLYHYPLTDEQKVALGRYRLIVKHRRDGRVCLSYQGRVVAAQVH